MAIATNFNTSSSISTALSYGSEKHKVGATLAVNCNPDKAVRDFEAPFNIYGKSNDRVKLHRLVIAFANKDDGSSELNNEDSQEYVRKFLEITNNHLGGNYPIVAYQNINTDYNHFHIYIGACGFNGKKLHPKRNPITFGRRLNSSLAMQYGLKQMHEYNRDYKDYRQFTDKYVSHYTYLNGKLPYSYKDTARQVISKAILNSSDLSSFNRAMNEQDCSVSNNLYSTSKMMNVYIPYRYQNGERKKGQRFRNLRTRTLGKYFSKDNIKEAIYSNGGPLLDKYQFLAQGPIYEFSDKDAKSSADNRMKGVQYKDDRFNLINQIKASSVRARSQEERTKLNSRKIDANSVYIKKQESNYKRYAPKVKSSSRISPSSTSSIRPNLSGLSKREREEVLADEKFLNALSNLIDELTSDFQSIFSDRKKQPYHRHHSMTKSGFKEKMAKQNHIIHQKKANERKHELRGQYLNESKNNKSLLPNEQRKRYNKLHSNNRNHHINFH